jgi:hypothetical protein
MPIRSTIIYCNRRFKAVFGRPLTSYWSGYCNLIRHSFSTSLDLNNEAQLQYAAKRLAHTNIDTLQRLTVCVGGAQARAGSLIMYGLQRVMPPASN